MWVSKNRWKQIGQTLDSLQAQINRLEKGTGISTYVPYALRHLYPDPEFSHDYQIKKILQHLGLCFVTTQAKTELKACPKLGQKKENE